MIDASVLNTLREDPNVGRLRPTYGEPCPADLYRVIACVEESNAEFEGFVMHSWAPGRPEKLLGYPVTYTDAALPGEIFGGMWSDLKDGRPQHSAAFAYLKGSE